MNKSRCLREGGAEGGLRGRTSNVAEGGAPTHIATYSLRTERSRNCWQRCAAAAELFASTWVSMWTNRVRGGGICRRRVDQSGEGKGHMLSTWTNRVRGRGGYAVDVDQS
eukprot:748747-Prorocentrum_minimum.AAC.1